MCTKFYSQARDATETTTTIETMGGTESRRKQKAPRANADLPDTKMGEKTTTTKSGFSAEDEFGEDVEGRGMSARDGKRAHSENQLHGEPKQILERKKRRLRIQ